LYAYQPEDVLWRITQGKIRLLVLREGLPEEEIIAYSKEYHPTLIVMGTRGKSQKDMDLIGSVTGEVMKAIFLASLKSVKGTFSGIANTGTRFTSITSPVTLHPR